MNTDTHFNQGGGGAAYAVRSPGPVQLRAGDRVRLVEVPPVYGTVLHEIRETTGRPYFEIRTDNGQVVERYAESITFHGRPHEAFNKGDSQ